MSLTIHPIDRVADEEILYRRVPVGRNCYSYVDGKLQLSSQAFNDKKTRPSVDRAALCNNDPKHTQESPTDGVVSLIAGAVKNQKVPIIDPKGQLMVEYSLDVIPDPLLKNDSLGIKKDNKAHALITPTPEYRSDNNFKKVKERLAKLASEKSWLIQPHAI